MHDNLQAMALYERLGFRRIQAFTVKRRNSINERLYTGPELDGNFNHYAQIIIDEARRRGVALEPVDPPEGYFCLTFCERTVTGRESMSSLHFAPAARRCDDKTHTG